MLNKKEDKKLSLCPYTGLKKKCTPDCMLYREGIRIVGKEEKPIPFADCAHNIIADNVEALHNRGYMMQKEVGDLKNVIGLQLLQRLGMVQTPDLIRQAEKLLHDPNEKDDTVIKIDHKEVPQITDEGSKS